MKPQDVAFSYLGRTEKPKNAGFNDAEFEKKMKAVGFQPGHAWCCYFQELVFKEAYPEKFKELDKLFSASCVQTYHNFKNAAYLISELPREGYLVLWQMMKDGKPQMTGHAGIVYKLNSSWEFESIEGNSNDDGGREGYEVALQPNRKVLADVKNGLKVLGFIQI